MIIRSQNKKGIINMNNIDTISIEENQMVCFNALEESKGLLGKYSTEEKAIKVLDMITNAYTQYATIERGFGEVLGMYNLPKCFQMPQDSEV